MVFLWTFLDFLSEIFSGGLFGTLLTFIAAYAGVCYVLSYFFGLGSDDERK